MAAYGGVTIYVVAEDTDGVLTRPDWDESDDGAVSRTRIPYSNRSYSQYVGRTTPVLKLKVEILSDADYATLKAWRGDQVPRTLSNPFGDSVDVPNVLLQKVLAPKRLTYGEEWYCELEFEKVI